jgi:hypothetical protein
MTVERCNEPFDERRRRTADISAPPRRNSLICRSRPDRLKPEYFHTDVRQRLHGWFLFVDRYGFIGGNLAQGARCSRRSIVIAKMTFALAYFLIAAGAFLILTGLVAAALHRNALHSMAAL